MKLHYPKTDSLYVELKSGAGTEARKVAPGVDADLDADGLVIGLDIDQASRKLDLSTLELEAGSVYADRRGGNRGRA